MSQGKLLFVILPNNLFKIYVYGRFERIGKQSDQKCKFTFLSESKKQDEF